MTINKITSGHHFGHTETPPSYTFCVTESFHGLRSLLLEYRGVRESVTSSIYIIYYIEKYIIFLFLCISNVLKKINIFSQTPFLFWRGGVAVSGENTKNRGRVKPLESKRFFRL